MTAHPEPFRTWTHQARYAQHNSDMFSIMSAPGEHRKRCTCSLHTDNTCAPYVVRCIPGNAQKDAQKEHNGLGTIVHDFSVLQQLTRTCASPCPSYRARKTHRCAWDGSSALLTMAEVEEMGKPMVADPDPSKTRQVCVSVCLYMPRLYMCVENRVGRAL